MVRDRVRVRARVWIVLYMDAQTAVRIHTDNSQEMTHLSVWIPTDNNTNPEFRGHNTGQFQMQILD